LRRRLREFLSPRRQARICHFQGTLNFPGTHRRWFSCAAAGFAKRRLPFAVSTRVFADPPPDPPYSNLVPAVRRHADADLEHLSPWKRRAVPNDRRVTSTHLNAFAAASNRLLPVVCIGAVGIPDAAEDAIERRHSYFTDSGSQTLNAFSISST
jgi:hypothetical protein